jgi:hypothetical protein
MTTPAVTLTATLGDTSGTAVALSALRITLCGFGVTLPSVAGTQMVAKIRQDVKLVAGTLGAGLALWGNNQLTPAGTFYEIAVIDDKQNVVQAANYVLNVAGTVDLSSLLARTGTSMIGAVPNGAIPGGLFTVPVPVAGGGVGATTPVWYNGQLQDTRNYTLSGIRLAVNWNTTLGDQLYVQFPAAGNNWTGAPLTPFIAVANGQTPGSAYTAPTTPAGAQLVGVFLNGGYIPPSSYTYTPSMQSLSITAYATTEYDFVQMLFAVGPVLTENEPTGAYPGTAYVLASSPAYSGVVNWLFSKLHGFFRPGIDYSVNGTNVTMTIPTDAGDTLYAIYL